MQNVSARDTKAQILKAYNDLQRQLKQAQSDLTKAKKQKAGPAAPAAPLAGAPAVVQATDIASVLSGLEGLRKGFGESSGELQSRLTTEAEALSAIREEIAAIVAALKEVHDVEPGDDTLQTLIASWTSQSETFATEMTEARESFKEEMETAKTGWNIAKTENSARVKERNQSLNQTRSREKDEYQYDLQRRRGLDQDAYQQEQKALQVALDELRATSEKSWQEREAALAEREKEFAELEAKVAAFPGERETELKTAKSIGANIANRQANIKSNLLAREHKGLRQVYELKIASLETTIIEQSARTSTLSAQLSTAQKRAQELAVKAIEGAANETSFQAIKEIAMEQAKTPNKK